MQILKSKNISLRALEPEDLDFLFSTENDDSFWEVSSTLKPFSRHILKQYIANSHQDIFEAKQLRLVIQTKNTHEKIGLIDLFDYNPQHHRAGIGILILQNYQKRGIATEALKLFVNYAFTTLNIHQVFANIPADNINSVTLFEKLNFIKIGTKKDWIFYNGSYKNVHIYQLLKS